MEKDTSNWIGNNRSDKACFFVQKNQENIYGPGSIWGKSIILRLEKDTSNWIRINRSYAFNKSCKKIRDPFMVPDLFGIRTQTSKKKRYFTFKKTPQKS